MAHDSLTLGASLVFGLLFGSFLNVLIYRLPRNESVLWDRSRCPGCKEVIRWFDNIPILSYLFLRGHCRRCGLSIPLTYPIVELITACMAAFVVQRYGVSLKAAWLLAFLAVLIVITFIDWSHRIIPDVLSLGGVVFGWIGSIVCLDVSFIESLVGSAFGGGLLLAVALLYKSIRKIDGMGGGDVKLMAMIGAFLGWQMVFPVLFLASLFGSIYGIYLMRKGGTGQTAVAFGSFLAPAATIVYLFGHRLWELYTGL